MRILYIFSLMLLTCFASGQSEWQKINTPEGGSVSGLVESPSGYLFADLGSTGICRSADNGNSWEKVFNETNYAYPGRLVAASDGRLIVAKDSVLYRSADNGDTWEQILAMEGSQFSGTTISNNDILYTISGYYGEFLVGLLTLHVSEDLGESWVHRPIDIETSYTTAFLDINSQGILFMSSDDVLYRSEDQGESWRQTGAGRVWRWIITPTDELVAGYRYGDRLYVSVNNGAEWTEIYESPEIIPLHADSAGFIYAAFSGELIRINPDGSEWAELTQSLPASSVYSVLVSSSNDIFISTAGGNLFRSSDGGVSWVKSDHGISNKYYSYVNTLQGGEMYMYSDSLYMTTDGVTYSTVKDPSDRHKHFKKVFRYPDGDLFFYGDYGNSAGYVFKTTDNGETFEEIFYYGESFIITPSGTLLLHWDNGLLRSTDKGENWELMMNNHSGYTVVGPEGTIYVFSYPELYRSDDDGETIQLVNGLFTQGTIKAINSQGHVFATNDREDLYISTDGGVTWQYRSTFPPEIDYLIKMVIDTNDNMYVIGHYEGIYRSTDYGLTWQRYNEGLYEFEITRVDDLHLSHDGTLYCAYEGGIWKRNPGAMPAFFAKNADAESTGNPSGLTVYPNPATDKITITNNTPGETIRIYDLRGSLIGEFRSGSKSASQLNLSGYKPGVYILEGQESNRRVKALIE